jgi:hypothetical protein
MTASYSSSPYFEYYFEILEKVISEKNDFLIELNTKLTETVSGILKINTKFSYSTTFAPTVETENDFRYKISPKVKSQFSTKEYLQVFNIGRGFVRELSILDLIFNMGPEAVDYL